MNELLQQDQDMEKEPGLLDHGLVLAKRAGLILKVTFGTAVLAVVISLLMTKQYEGVARILPSQSGTPSASAMLMNQISSAMGGLAGGLASGLGAGTPSDVYADLLQGDAITDTILDRFQLMELFKIETRISARTMLSGIVSIKSDKKSGIITIKVLTKDPKLSADMANAYVDELMKFNNKLAVTDAVQRRTFYEAQVKDAFAALSLAEEDVRYFQESTGAIKMDSQATAIFEGIAGLRAQIAAKEIQLKVMKTYATPQNREVRQLEEELAGLREQLKNLEAQGASYYGDTVIPTDRIPGLNTEYLRKLREFKFRETLYDLLIKQYASARLDEANNVTTIQVVDSATVPDRKAKPKRALICIAATMAAFFLSIFMAFFAEHMDRMKEDPETREKIAKINEYLAPIRNHPLVAKPCRALKWLVEKCRNAVAKVRGAFKKKSGDS